jgi:hypothetical protein
MRVRFWHYVAKLPDPHPPAGTFSRWEKDLSVERIPASVF